MARALTDFSSPHAVDDAKVTLALQSILTKSGAEIISSRKAPRRTTFLSLKQRTMASTCSFGKPSWPISFEKTSSSQSNRAADRNMWLIAARTALVSLLSKLASLVILPIFSWSMELPSTMQAITWVQSILKRMELSLALQKWHWVWEKLCETKANIANMVTIWARIHSGASRSPNVLKRIAANLAEVGCLRTNKIDTYLQACALFCGDLGIMMMMCVVYTMRAAVTLPHDQAVANLSRAMRLLAKLYSKRDQRWDLLPKLEKLTKRKKPTLGRRGRRGRSPSWLL